MDKGILFQSLGNSILGMVIVFSVLVILMVAIVIMSKVIKPKKVAVADAPKQQPTAAPTPAKGSCGEIKLNGVPEKTAAMLMAITADKLQKPLNTLRFISIKEVK